ncbi:MAG: hypothetical protein LBD92_07900, partial [Oscillospiraceae bacterium]|nr:hypothetical protein [Oscillospiraceae bacterium]
LRGERTNDGASKFPALAGNLLSAVREDETHSCAKILFAYAEKNGRAKIAANEIILSAVKRMAHVWSRASRGASS